MSIDVKPQPRKSLKTRIGPISCFIEAKEFFGDQYWLYLGIMLVGLLIAGAVPLILLGPAYCGIGICLLGRATGREVKFEESFKGFDYFGQSLITALLYMLIVFCGFIPFAIGFVAAIAMISTENEVLNVLGAVLIGSVYLGWIIFAFFVPVIVFFACILIVDRQMEGVAATKLACRALLANFWGLLAVTLLGQLIMVVGMMMCIVPGILAIPLLFGSQFMAYRKIFGITISPAVPEAVIVE